MILVEHELGTDPRLNLAMEEHLLRNLETDEDILLFYINEPSIILGRYQNVWEEINLEYVDAHPIHVVRRISGGGTVYHDLGNLNYSFITQKTAEDFHNFKKFTAPVIAVLREMGLQAELDGRSNILVGGRKISGNAQYIASRRMVSHGTLLYHSDLNRVSEALRVKPGKIVSKSIKSVRSQVANISEFLDQPPDLEAFRQHLVNGIFKDCSEIPLYWLTQADREAIHALALERYGTWEWNYGNSPDCVLEKAQRFAFGEVETHLEIRHGLIHTIKFNGDFSPGGEIASLEARLAGVRYFREDLAEALQRVDLEPYFEGMTVEALIRFIL